MMPPKNSHNVCFDGYEFNHVLQLEILYIGRAIVGPEWQGVSDISLTTYKTFHLAIDGEAELKVNGKMFSLKAGHMYFIPNQFPTERSCPERYEQVYGGFCCRDIGGNDLLKEQKYPLELGTWDPGILEETEHGLDTLSAQLLIKAMLEVGLIRSLPGFADALNKPQALMARFSKSISFIKENLSAKIEIKTLADLEGLSRNAYSRAFRQAVGMTPKSYLNNELNQLACRMVLRSNLSIREIGEQLGFTDEYYFNRFFSRMNGVPPLRYRRSMNL